MPPKEEPAAILHQQMSSHMRAKIRLEIGIRAALLLLKLIGLFTPGKKALAITAKQIAYQLQWLTPYSVSELARNKAVFDIPRCKILDFPDTDAICLVGCQSTYPMWVAEQFKVYMKFNPLGNSCTWTLTPLT